MPIGVVKTPADEKKWERAKEVAAEQGKAKRWPLIMHIFKQMSKTDGEDRNVKIEQALAAQGKKTTIPHEFHEMLHDMWQKEKATALTPEQHARLAEIKSVKERRKQIKLIKQEQRKEAAARLVKSLFEIKEALEKAAKSKLRDWEPKTHNPDESGKIQKLTDQGFHPREAAHLSGVRHVKDTHPYTKATPLSDPMLTMAREVASDHLKEYMQTRGAMAQPEHNPNIHVQHQAKQTAKQHTGDYKKDLAEFQGSKEFKDLNPTDHGKAISQFKLNWLKQNKEKMIGALTQATSKMAEVQADTHAKREKEKHEIRANIARGGHGAVEPTSTSEEYSDYDLEPDLEERRG